MAGQKSKTIVYKALWYMRYAGKEMDKNKCPHSHRSVEAAASCGARVVRDITNTQYVPTVMDAGWSVAERVGGNWRPVR